MMTSDWYLPDFPANHLMIVRTLVHGKSTAGRTLGDMLSKTTM